MVCGARHEYDTVEGLVKIRNRIRKKAAVVECECKGSKIIMLSMTLTLIHYLQLPFARSERIWADRCSRGARSTKGNDEDSDEEKHNLMCVCKRQH